MEIAKQPLHADVLAGKVISERLGSGKHVAFSFPVHDGDKPFQVAHERKEARNPLHTIRDEYLLPKVKPQRAPIRMSARRGDAQGPTSIYDASHDVRRGTRSR